MRPETDNGSDGLSLRDLVVGQNLVAWSILLYGLVLAAIGVRAQGVEILIIIPFLIGLVGTIRVLDGLNSRVVIRIVFMVLLFLPVLNILALARLYSLATTSLRQAGGKVGFLGARQ